nr:BREX-1 system adenine-specific DNA-methyltransferase PglX [Bradyrhizobium sp. CW9]
MQTFVTKARLVLSDEFTKQFQQDFGLDPNSGTVSPLDSLSHLDDQRLATARLLREIFDHYLPATMSTAAEARKTTLDRMVREQAFTTLNRLAALRMMEARGLVRECVGKSYQSQAFQLYQHVAGTALGETGDAYHVFLLSVCDVYCADMPVLFNRHFPNGRLFPREPALLPLLDLINAPDIAPFWGEDETIGWIYQYFNSKEERQAMRDPKQGGSQAPRDSRELAVRNQFFTPRYVVEFLVDNTLGRLWFNWTGGQTALRYHCKYLLVEPHESPASARGLRDPRTIKLLDPACGSMHFGLYAFDLFQKIYSEAWEWEQANGPGSLDREAGGSPDLKPLSEVYADQDTFLRDMPRLIIEHNIYGVDIDPRAAQIASLALWLRAQRAWHEAGVKAKDRPQVGRGHVVAAVAPPAEVDLRKRFIEELDPLDAELFEKTLFLLKGLPELGVLLQVEKELPALVRQVFGEHGDLFREADIAQWQKAEERLREALTEFARAARSTYQGRLFADDAQQLFDIIDLLSRRYEVVLMNPPFGLAPEDAFSYAKNCYPHSYIELLAAFVERGQQLSDGYLGAITSRSFMVASRLAAWRENCIVGRLLLLADLGDNIMDDAFVEAAAYVTSVNAPDTMTAIDLREADQKEFSLRSGRGASSENTYRVDQSLFLSFPKNRIIYFAGSKISKLLREAARFEPGIGTARQGQTTFDDFRFVRNFWEVKPSKIGKGRLWEYLAKGGPYSRYRPNVHLLMRWGGDGSESRAINMAKNGTDAQARQAFDYWHREGLTYSMRSQRGFSARIMPRDCLFTGQGPLICSESKYSNQFILGWINSDLIRTIIEMQSNDGKYMSGLIKALPWMTPPKDSDELERKTLELCQNWIALDSISNVASPYFNSIPSRRSINSIHIELRELYQETKKLERDLDDEWNEFVCSYYGISHREVLEIRSLLADEFSLVEEPEDAQNDGEIEDLNTFSVRDTAELIVEYLVGYAFGHWSQAYDQAEHSAPATDVFDPLPSAPPGRSLPGTALGSSRSSNVNAKVENGIIASKLAYSGGLYHDLRRAGEKMLGGEFDEFESDLCKSLNVKDLRDYLDLPSGYFQLHLRKHTLSRRKAPIYWPLSTTSGSYSLWLHYPSLTSQTLYTAVNDFVEPKLKQVEHETGALRNKVNARSRDEDQKLEMLQLLESELVELRDTLLQIAPTYRADHDDGVQITAAPLWPLFRHKPWQKLLKDTWTKLEKGEYDWAHLAMAYWPERVREKCKTDKSLAIAHDLETLYVEPAPKPAKARGKKGAGA